MMTKGFANLLTSGLLSPCRDCVKMRGYVFKYLSLYLAIARGKFSGGGRLVVEVKEWETQ